MAIFNKDMVALATKNTHFQKKVYRDENCQIVLMSIEPGDDIGEETHDADQTTFFVAGEGQAKVDGSTTKVTPNHLIVIPRARCTTSSTRVTSRSSCSASTPRRPRSRASTTRPRRMPRPRRKARTEDKSFLFPAKAGEQRRG